MWNCASCMKVFSFIPKLDLVLLRNGVWVKDGEDLGCEGNDNGLKGFTSSICDIWLGFVEDMGGTIGLVVSWLARGVGGVGWGASWFSAGLTCEDKDCCFVEFNVELVD